MKNIQKIKRVQLIINQSDEFIILGLVSSEPDYKLSLTINKKFGISLKNISPVRIIDGSGSELIFSRFADTNGSPGTIFTLFSNRSGKHFLIRNLKNIDYIFQVHNPDDSTKADSLTASLRKIDSINAVFNIDLNTFKDKNIQYLI